MKEKTKERITGERKGIGVQGKLAKYINTVQ